STFLSTKTCRRRAVACGDAKPVSFTEPQSGMSGLAEPRRVRENGLEHPLKIAWRTADDAENLRGRRLPLQRFAQLAGDHCLPLRSRLLPGQRFVELAGQQCDLFFVTGRASCRNRLASRRLHGLASLRLRTVFSTSCHPIPLTG